ncbi:hypothetical protein JIN85_16910 [Luteolibacter pohnpeiensis]|uniref:Uncharacterized protein n=1 Tax=Luteolibacter pohnpeiensis TaxID=454153 RepID=A0A934SF90_9BACT|nr:hypothetical protein [Luteolibacter pohnpeiensis]MBK1884103.1 hypothetical protein [Luteolibacter pohnpeiensis]
MLAGYRDLPTLKARLLPGAMGDGWEYGEDLRTIGLGVAAMFDQFTGRTLRRTVDAEFECAADLASVVVSCYPIEGNPVVSIQDGLSESVISELIVGIQRRSGIIHFGGAPSDSTRTLRIVNTGGFWCQDDEGDDATPPAGATPLPDDLLHAWYHQVRAICEAEQIFRSKAAGRNKDDKALDLTTIELMPGVLKTLQLYIRMG